MADVAHVAQHDVAARPGRTGHPPSSRRTTPLRKNSNAYGAVRSVQFIDVIRRPTARLEGNDASVGSGVDDDAHAAVFEDLHRRAVGLLQHVGHEDVLGRPGTDDTVVETHEVGRWVAMPLRSWVDEHDRDALLVQVARAGGALRGGCERRGPTSARRGRSTLRAGEQRTREEHPLLLTARQVADVATTEVVQPQPVEDVGDLRSLCLRDPRRSARPLARAMPTHSATVTGKFQSIFSTWGTNPTVTPLRRVTVPARGSMPPSNAFSSVDLPEPEGPTMPIRSPASTVRSTSEITGSAP